MCELEDLYIQGKVLPLISMVVKAVHWHWCPSHGGRFMCGYPWGFCDRLSDLNCYSCIASQEDEEVL